MTTFLALDPSQETCGVALFRRGRLIDANIVRYPNEMEYRGFNAGSFMRISKAIRGWVDLRPLDEIVFELPQHYRKVPVDDLLPLAVIGGMVCGLFGADDCSFVRPSEWGASGKPKRPKGGGPVPPYPVEVKVRARLDADEIMRLGPCPKSLSHNMFDAVAIGLHAVGRGIAAERKRVIAR